VLAPRGWWVVSISLYICKRIIVSTKRISKNLKKRGPTCHTLVLHWPALAFDGPSLAMSAVVGPRWPALSVVGVVMSGLGVVSLRWAVLVLVSQ
jgi:hypothetical protein